MEQRIFDLIFWGVFVGGGSVFVIFTVIMAIRQYNQQKGNDCTAVHSYKETRIEIKATVKAKNCCVETAGTRLPKTVRSFYVFFETEERKQLKVDVPEEMYGGFENGQTGILTLVNGSVYSFEI